MKRRVDIIAAALRTPRLQRPYVAHEVRKGVVQLLGRSTEPDWTATIPQLAQAVDEALTLEEKDTPAAGATSTARAQILAALRAAGHTAASAAALLAQADHEPRSHAPDPDFRECLGGGHALVVEYGDCQLIGSCQCGKSLGATTPDASLDTFVRPWEHHTNTEVT